MSALTEITYESGGVDDRPIIPVELEDPRWCARSSGWCAAAAF